MIEHDVGFGFKYNTNKHCLGEIIQYIVRWMSIETTAIILYT